MAANLVILTPGSSGSSVLSGFLAEHGYWVGGDTKKIFKPGEDAKLDFDTFENAGLVDLDIRILKESGYANTICTDLPAPDPDAVRAVAERIDVAPFRAFAEQCDKHQPWVWKDPRLCYTIHFWNEIVDWSQVRFIYMGREAGQSYAGQLLSRRVPMSYAENVRILDNYWDSCHRFFERTGAKFVRITFEDLICEPEATVEKLAAFVGTDLDVAALERTYRGNLREKRYSGLQIAGARARYLLHRWVKRDHVVFPRVAPAANGTATSAAAR